MPDLLPYLAEIANNTQATVEALQTLPTPEAPVVHVPEIVPNVVVDIPDPVIEWHFEIKRNSLNLITDVIARGVVQHD